MGSDSDLPHLEDCIALLKDFGVEPSVRVLSAHRTPEDTARFARDAEKNGFKVLIAAAGGAAHLAGAIAAQTTLPVLGVPIPSSSLQGLDALLATVQMPAGIPVATLAIGKAGGSNAALFALEILGLSDESIAKALKEFRAKKADAVRAKDAKLGGSGA
jgi:phosphoribosylaminoimidazole carboxylase PurE protein